MKHYFELSIGLVSVDATALIVVELVNFAVVGVDIEAKLGFDIVVVVD